jgi:hypothetical protein
MAGAGSYAPERLNTAFSILVFSCPSMGRKNNSGPACGFRGGLVRLDWGSSWVWLCAPGYCNGWCFWIADFNSSSPVCLYFSVGTWVFVACKHLDNPQVFAFFQKVGNHALADGLGIQVPVREVVLKVSIR